MATLRELLHQEMLGYTGQGINARNCLTISPDGDLFAIITFAQLQDKRVVDAGLIARLVRDKIVIELDMNNKILADALEQAGVPREKIVLAYIGETVEEAQEQAIAVES